MVEMIFQHSILRIEFKVSVKTSGKMLCYRSVIILLHRDGQFRIIYYSRIVKPNPESESFFCN